MKSIRELIETIEKFKPGAPLEKYIGSIRFPNFKNIEPGTRVDFAFPLTVLVGANGSGKSSILHALYGAPEKYSLKDFWFSTELDPIVEGKGLGVSRFIYAHWNSHIGDFVETRKARVRSGARLDYWEPTKIVVSDGMKPLPPGSPVGAASDRWLPVERSVVHINFKAEISAFDRFFYFETGQRKEDKHIAMLREARRLKQVIDHGYTSYRLWNRERVFENRSLRVDELECVRHILGHDYVSATMVRHTLYPGYRGQDISVLFERPTLKYSEAFAGSGEVAVVSSVVKLLAANPGSLVLLDEPETSLHPGAQRRFLQFLLDCIVRRKMQIVISTHSPEFVDELPDHAIKVLEVTPTGRVTVANGSSSLVAFNRLGAKAPGRLRVIVEDELARKVVEVARRGLPAGERELIDAVVVPGGASMILAHYIPSAIAGKDATFALLDGDQAFPVPLPDVAHVAPADEARLGDKIFKSTGVEPALYLSGGSDPALLAKKAAAQKEYIKWVSQRVRFLPRTVPEEIVIRAAFPKLVSALDGTGETAKDVLYKQIALDVAEATGAQIIEIAAYELSKHASQTQDIDEISKILAEFIAIWRAGHAS